jgi:ankyrin repeat protein
MFRLRQHLKIARLPDYHNRRIPKCMNRKQSIFCTAILPVVLTWSSLAFCDEIHDAAKSGDWEKVKALLKANPDLVFETNTVGMTPLFDAAIYDLKDVAKLLLTHKAEVNAKDNVGEPAMR